MESNLTLEKFESEPRIDDTFTFFVTQVAAMQSENFKLMHPHRINALLTVPIDCGTDVVRKVCATLAIILHSGL